MAGADVPLDVMLEGGPPKSVKERAVHRKEAPVAKVIMSIMNEGNAEVGRNIKLMAALGLLVPESPICKEELLGLFEKADTGSIIEVVGLLESGEIVVDELDFFVGLV